MRGVVIGLLLLASCAGQDPRENAALFDDAAERAKRDVSTIYYLENAVVVVSVIIGPRGPAEACGEWSQAAYERMRRRGIGASRRFDQDSVVQPSDRDAIEAYFAGLPAGASERTLSTDPKPPPDYSRLKGVPGRYCIFGPDTEVERVPAVPSRVRILHVSKSGELKTLTVFRTASKDFPPGVSPGGDALESLDRMFALFAAPKLDFSNVRFGKVMTAAELND